MYTERARRFGLTSTHWATLSRISTLSLGSHLHIVVVPLEDRSQQLRQLVEGVLIHGVHPAKESPHLGSKSLSDGRCYDHHHDSYCSHLLEHVFPSAGSEALPRSRRGHRINRCVALSTVSHGPSRYPMVRDLVVPPTEPSRFAAGELGKGGKNLEEIGAKFLGPNCFRVFFFLIEERLPTFSRFREIWKFGSKLGNV